MKTSTTIFLNMLLGAGLTVASLVVTTEAVEAFRTAKCEGAKKRYTATRLCIESPVAFVCMIDPADVRQFNLDRDTILACDPSAEVPAKSTPAPRKRIPPSVL